MCGIAGWLGHVSPGDVVARRILQRLSHRGPDGVGVQSWPQAALLHTRLSILDLSPAGSQPMCNEDQTVWVSFNGEIYNHHELRHHLEKNAHIFRSHSDTEVIPHLYEEEGLAFVSKLRGMFALAIYDTRTRRLFLVRDRCGIKPLFYAPTKHYLAFASEIGPLLSFPDIDDRPDPQAIYDLTALRYIPAPETFYKGIRALEPGSILEASMNGSSVSWNIHSYHHWSMESYAHLTIQDAVDRANDLMNQAITRQLESDVPWGTLLSGGIDSTLVSQRSQQAAEEQVPSFHLTFGNDTNDESPLANLVAHHIGSQHRQVKIPSDSGDWEYITGLLSHIGQPFADTSVFGVNMIARYMRQYVKVSLSGDGGDEGFCGYERYGRLKRIAQLRRLPDFMWKCLWHGSSLLLSPLVALRVMNSQPIRKRILAQSGDDISIMQYLFCEISEHDTQQLCPDLDALPIRRLFEPTWKHKHPADLSPAERLFLHAAEIDVRLKLPNDQLFKVDIASMKEGLEIRVPMLDEDLLEFGLLLPWDLKVKGRSGKLVLRELARKDFPARVTQQPKQGFSVPIDTWVNQKFKQQLREELLNPGNSLSHIFAPKVFRPMIEAFCENRAYHGLSRKGLYRRAILLLSVHLALQKKSLSVAT